ncbi:hypothetical protein ACFZCP_14240 [Streptomyces sp. NPDC007971]|uniref:hypothetical protein n=1 Tax=Streptomyces sp. NPDC007971 TaxID=3364799 RepID=UPI0036E1AFAF
MSNDVDVPTEKVAIYFTGKIVVDASLMDCEGTVRTTEDVVRNVIGDIESEVREHLMYSDENREEYDLVQAIDELDIQPASEMHLVGLAEKVKAWESVDGAWVDIRDQYRDEHGDETDSEALDKLIVTEWFQKFWDVSEEVKSAAALLLSVLPSIKKPEN